MMKHEIHDAKDRPRRGGLRVPGAAALTLIFAPLLILLSVVLLLLNLIHMVIHRNRRAAPAAGKPLSGLVSIIILNWNGKELLAQGLPSVIEAVAWDRRPHEILVVDNGSQDGSADYVRKTFPQVRILELPENRGFARGNNEGVKAARHDIVLLLNNDMIVDRGFLRPLLDSFGPDTFAVSSQIRKQDPAAIRHETGRTSAVFRRGFVDYSHREVREQEMTHPHYPVFWAGGGSSAFHRERFLQLGGFQEIYSPAYVEDTDLSFEAWRAGWEVLFAPDSIVLHRHRATAGRCFSAPRLERLILRNQLVFLWKNMHSWRLLAAHCAFLPWNGYRLARDHGPGIWLSFLQAAARLPRILAARRRMPFAEVRRDREVFRSCDNGALYWSRTRMQRLAAGGGPPRILWMTPYLPYLGRHAGSGRMYHLLARIADRYRITLLTFLEDEAERAHLPRLQAMCEKVVCLPRTPPFRWQPFAYEPFREFLVPQMKQALLDCVESRDYDLIQLEYTQMAEYADREFGIPMLLSKHEVDFAAWARRARVEDNPFRKLRWFYNHLQVLDREVSLTRRVDAVICVTEPDRSEWNRFCTSVPTHVINTGVDLEYFQPRGPASADSRLVYVGAFQHEPNVDAMIYFCGKVLPLVRAQVPTTELTIVGSQPPARIRELERIPGVRVTGFVDDIRPTMAKASVYVVPLRLGVGIRGKILEAWGMALPVVATSVAAAGLHCQHGENLLIADTAADMAAGIAGLLRDPVRRAALGSAGRKTAEQHYGWDAIAAQLDEIYKVYLDRAAPGRETQKGNASRR